MPNELALLARYALMIVVGHYATLGYIQSDMTEVYISLGVALVGLGWKLFDSYILNKKV